MSIGVALLVSNDLEAIQRISHGLQELSISPDICREAAVAIRLLNRRKFDAVVVDLQLGERAGSVLDEAHLSRSNRTAVTFAISGSDAEAKAAFPRASSFVFQRPLSQQSIRSTLHPAYGLILRERRRYFRCPISLPVVLVRDAKPEVHCYTANLSEGGAALSTIVPLPPGEQLQVRFYLPAHEVPCLAKATICWWKEGRLGLRFDSMPDAHKFELQVWLAEKIEDLLPNFVAETFQKNGANHSLTAFSHHPH